MMSAKRAVTHGVLNLNKFKSDHIGSAVNLWGLCEFLSLKKIKDLFLLIQMLVINKVRYHSICF